MNRKVYWVSSFLLALCMFLSSFRCFAEEFPIEKPDEYPIRVSDESGKPITNMYIYALIPSLANPSHDHSLTQTAGFTDENGLFTYITYYNLSINLNPEPKIDPEHGKYSLPKLDQVNGVYQVVWDAETPLELANKSDNSFRLRVVDQAGKPVSGLVVTAVEKNFAATYPEETPRKVLEGYTDQDGYFSSLAPLDGSELRLCVSSERDGKEGTTKYYKITPSPTGRNKYKITW